MGLVGCREREMVIHELAVTQRGSWGDQGDGTYRNPVLKSNFPDSDVEPFNGKWDMIS